VNCAKTAEPIKMQFGMPSQVGPGNMYYIGCRCSHKKGAFLCKELPLGVVMIALALKILVA